MGSVESRWSPKHCRDLKSSHCATEPYKRVGVEVRKLLECNNVVPTVPIYNAVYFFPLPVPSNYGYLSEGSILRLLFDFLVQAGKTGWFAK